MRLAIAWMMLALAGFLRADTIHLSNGGTLDGVVLKEDGDKLSVRLKHGVVMLKRSEVASIDKAAAPGPQACAQRLPGWTRCVDTLAACAWAKDLRQIPATVIDKGALRHVPYLSFRAGDHEFNLYGDPDAPAGVEVGITRQDRLTSEAAKKECFDLIASLLSQNGDRELLVSLDQRIDKEVREGLTFEVTPETAEDAYGGWWISIYDERALDAARASDEEIRRITESRKLIQQADPEPKSDDSSAALWERGDLEEARPPDGDQDRVYRRDYRRQGNGYTAPTEYTGVCGATTRDGGS